MIQMKMSSDTSIVQIDERKNSCFPFNRLSPDLKTIFINVSYHIFVASLTLMALF